MTDWHARYGGPGVMVYWHAEQRPVCMFSQLGRRPGREVAAMIGTVLRHDTEMEVEKTSVDTHGQSEVGSCVLPPARLSAAAVPEDHQAPAAVPREEGRTGESRSSPAVPTRCELIGQPDDSSARTCNTRHPGRWPNWGKP